MHILFYFIAYFTHFIFILFYYFFSYFLILLLPIIIYILLCYVSFFILFFCTVHWADLSWPTFHYWLYPVWLCMWQIIKNLAKLKRFVGLVGEKKKKLHFRCANGRGLRGSIHRNPSDIRFAFSRSVWKGLQTQHFWEENILMNHARFIITSACLQHYTNLLFVDCVSHYWKLLFFSVGVLRLIGYRSVSADNRLGMFDRRSLKISSWWRTCCERFGTTCSGTVSVSVQHGWNNYNAKGEVQFIFIN